MNRSNSPKRSKSPSNNFSFQRERSKSPINNSFQRERSKSPANSSLFQRDRSKSPKGGSNLFQRDRSKSPKRSSLFQRDRSKSPDMMDELSKNPLFNRSQSPIDTTPAITPPVGKYRPGQPNRDELHNCI